MGLAVRTVCDIPSQQDFLQQGCPCFPAYQCAQHSSAAALATASLAERAFQCVAREGREGAQGSSWRGGREHRGKDPLGSSELPGQTSH